MQRFIILVREPDGRAVTPPEEENKVHRANWNKWFDKYKKTGNFLGGSALSLNGKLIKGPEAAVIDDIHKTGTEIVGGYLLIQADSLDAAVEIAREIPVFEVDGYLEVRELMVTG
ncbi:MAG: hypothetical protein JST19_04905 [Bacteroidetes bacterium]|nr:hypothetical protein [Bacteroidota bacterium]